MEKKPKEINLLAIGIVVLTVLAIIIILLVQQKPSDEPSDVPSTSELLNTESTTQPTTETTEPTEPEPVYEKQTVYLCVRTTMENWDESGSSEILYFYDEYGNSIKSENVNYGTWSEYTYDDWGNLLIQQNYSADGTIGGRYEYTYNENGQMLSQKYFRPDGSQFSEHYYTYDESDRLLSEVYRYMENDYLYEHIYSEDGSELRINNYNHGELTGYTLQLFDANGLMYEQNSYKADGTWSYRQTCEYDSQGRLVLEWNYDSHELQPNYDVIYTYDENGLLVYKNVDYYYGYGMKYFYEAFEILVRVK